jgi:hypothetical protein
MRSCLQPPPRQLFRRAAQPVLGLCLDAGAPARAAADPARPALPLREQRREHVPARGPLGGHVRDS